MKTQTLPYVRVFVWAHPRDQDGKRRRDRKVVAVAEAPLAEAFRSDGHTLAGELGKLYRKYVANPDFYLSVHHIRH